MLDTRVSVIIFLSILAIGISTYSENLLSDTRDYERLFAKESGTPVYESPGRKSKVIVRLKIGHTLKIQKNNERKSIDGMLWVRCSIPKPNVINNEIGGWINIRDFYLEKDFGLADGFQYTYLKIDREYWYEEHFFSQSGDVEINFVEYTEAGERRNQYKHKLYSAGNIFALYDKYLGPTLFIYDPQLDQICPPLLIGDKCKQYLEQYGSKYFISRKKTKKKN